MLQTDKISIKSPKTSFIVFSIVYWCITSFFCRFKSDTWFEDSNTCGIWLFSPNPKMVFIWAVVVGPYEYWSSVFLYVGKLAIEVVRFSKSLLICQETLSVWTSSCLWISGNMISVYHLLLLSLAGIEHNPLKNYFLTEDLWEGQSGTRRFLR